MRRIPYWYITVAQNSVEPDEDGEGGVEGFDPIPLCQLRIDKPHILADLHDLGLRLPPGTTCSQEGLKLLAQLAPVWAKQGYILAPEKGPCPHDIGSLEPEKDDPEHLRY